MGAIISSQYKYQAFISYAHKDEDIAARLQQALEKFPIPKALRQDNMARISPIFRDVTDLTAHHSLSSKIEDAVKVSRFLIVLCSPAAKASKWVNEEIRLFRKLHGEASILCALIDGTPQTSFPEALTELGREPLAANLGPKHFRLGTTQLAASIVGVGLDDLVQRDAKRRRRLMYSVTAASLLFSGVMAVSSWNAVKARNEAQLSGQRAENSRNEAEKLVEFMLSDLTDDLEPIGKLGIIDNVGDQISAYYEAIPLSEMNEEHLARRARSMHLLGQVAIAQGREDEALKGLLQAREVTKALLNRSPEDNLALEIHAQSEYSLLRAYENQDRNLAARYGQSYKALSKQVYLSDTANLEYMAEYGWACNKLGQLYQILKDLDNAKAQFSEAVSIYQRALIDNPDDNQLKFKLITFERNLALIEHEQGHHKAAIEGLEDQALKLSTLIKEETDNFQYRDSHYLTHLWIQNIQILNLKTCNTDQVYDLTAQMEALIEHDPSNRYWKSDLINFAHTSIKGCASYLEKDWIRSTISSSEKSYALLSQKNDRLTQNYIWLQQYEPGSP